MRLREFLRKLCWSELQYCWSRQPLCTPGFHHSACFLCLSGPDLGFFLYKNLNPGIFRVLSVLLRGRAGFRLSLACLCCRRNLVTERRWNAVQQLTGLSANVLVALADFPCAARRVRACRSSRPCSGCRARRVRSWAPSACSSRCHNSPINFSCVP